MTTLHNFNCEEKLQIEEINMQDIDST